MRLPAGRQGLRNVDFCKRKTHKRFCAMLYACPPNRFFGRRALCAMLFTEMMQDEKEDELEEAKELLKEGLKKIFQATKKVSEKVVEGFREGYAEDITKKEK
jgi:hypothetical protein